MSARKVWQTHVLNHFLEAENSPLRTATNSMPMYINYVQCSGAELTLLDCSYSRHHTDIDHSKDLGVQCGKGKILASSLIMNGEDRLCVIILHSPM